MSNTNQTQGKQRPLLIRNDDDTEWEVAGGVENVSISRDRPVETTTSTSTTGPFNESAHTGFDELTISISGKHDKRAPFVHTNGFTVVASARINEIIDTKDGCWKFRIPNLDTGAFVEGNFNITNYASNSDINALATFEMTLQTATETTMSGEV